MKKIITLTLLFVISMMMFSQNNNPRLTREDYLQKSKDQKKAVLILKVIGAPLLIGGIIWGATNQDIAAPWVLATAGGICILATIPLHLASENNKRRALSMSFNWQQSIQLQNNCLLRKVIPSLTLRMSLFKTIIS